MQLIFPWYKFATGKSGGSIESCVDKSDQTFEADIPCPDRRFFLSEHEKTFDCSSSGSWFAQTLSQIALYQLPNISNDQWTILLGSYPPGFITGDPEQVLYLSSDQIPYISSDQMAYIR